MTPLQQIDAVIELLTPEGAWCQHDFAKTADGKSLHSGWQEGACCFCPAHTGGES